MSRTGEATLGARSLIAAVVALGLGALLTVGLIANIPSSSAATISPRTPAPRPPSSPTTSSTVPPSVPATPTAALGLPAAPTSTPATIVDPTISRPDASVIWDPVSHLYRMYTTKQWWANVPEWTAPSAIGPWTYAGDALPIQPPGNAASDYRLWAPQVADVNGVWTLWGAAGITGSPAVCLYRATALRPAGPFTVTQHQVAPCVADRYGAIDPEMVEDAGVWWLIYKIDANAAGQDASIVAQQLGPDGLPTGPTHTLITADLSFEDGLVEAPEMFRDPVTAQWWLAYSGGQDAVAPSTYQIMAAPCASLTGPCDQTQMVHLVSTNAQGTGPGEEKIFVDQQGRLWMDYSPDGPFLTPPGGLRPLALVRLGFTSTGIPFVAPALSR